MVMEAIKKGFGIASKCLALVAVLFAINLVFNLVGMPLAPKPGTQPTSQQAVAAIFFSLIFILISILVQGGTLGLVKDQIKEGRMKLGGFLSYGAKYYLRLLGLGILIILLVAVVAIIAALVIGLTAPLNNAAITAVAIVIAIAIAVLAGLLYFLPLTLSPYAIVADDLGIIAAMKKSLQVVRAPRSRILSLLALFILILLISLGVGFILGFVVGMISMALPATTGQVLMAVVTSAINGYLGLVMMAALMVFYMDISRKTA